MRSQILEKIGELARNNDGRPPGVRMFESVTGIRESDWRGVYWARWGDAVKEAGFEPNTKQEKFEESFFLSKLAEACRRYGKFPTAMELRMYQKEDAQFPNVKSITRHFGSLTHIPNQLAEWAKLNNDYADIVEMLGGPTVAHAHKAATQLREGSVYLIRSGAYYKIGRSDELERRVKEIRIALPDSATLEHSIRTDDPPGIESYWHRRFQDKRANGEWFKLDRSDIAAFKRRKFQ